MGQTFTLTGRPKVVFRIVWRGSIKGVDCVQGVTLNAKFQTFSRLAEVVFVHAAYNHAERCAIGGAKLGLKSASRSG